MNEAMIKSAEEGLILASDVPCVVCGQTPIGQTGEYPCEACGLPTTHDRDFYADPLHDLWSEMRAELIEEGGLPGERVEGYIARSANLLGKDKDR